MLKINSIAEIRRRHFVDGESISALSKELKLSSQMIRKALKITEEPIYQRKKQAHPKWDDFQSKLLEWLIVGLCLRTKKR